MGKKVSPHSFRLGITRTWGSLWYAKRGFATKFLEDLKVRKFLQKKLAPAGVSKIDIKRTATKNTAVVHTAKPGLIIGRGGEAIQELQKEVEKQCGVRFEVTVQEIRKPDADAQLVANNIAQQIEKRFPFRRVMKTAIERAKENGVKGIKIRVAGRLNGVDIARSEQVNFGTIPLHTLRANIDYALAEANTTYGVIGIKVWVYHGLVFKNEQLNG